MQMKCEVCGHSAPAKTHPCRFEKGCSCWRGRPCRLPGKFAAGKKETREVLDNPRKNVERAFAAWQRGVRLKPSKSIWTNGATIYSYKTWLLHRNASGEVTLNDTKYSHTTSTQQSGLKYLLRGTNFDTLTGVRQGSDYQDLNRNPRKRSRKNPPLVTFGNPSRTVSKNVVEIRYIHAEDGYPYKHRFARGRVHILATPDSKIAILKRVDGKPIIKDY